MKVVPWNGEIYAKGHQRWLRAVAIRLDPDGEFEHAYLTEKGIWFRASDVECIQTDEQRIAAVLEQIFDRMSLSR